MLLTDAKEDGGMCHSSSDTRAYVQKKQYYTRVEVSRSGFDNNKQWMIINDKIYDLKRFSQFHPGGAYVLRTVVNEDATEQFYGIHSEKTIKRFERGLYAGYVVGTVAEDDDHESPHASSSNVRRLELENDTSSVKTVAENMLKLHLTHHDDVVVMEEEASSANNLLRQRIVADKQDDDEAEESDDTPTTQEPSTTRSSSVKGERDFFEQLPEYSASSRRGFPEEAPFVEITRKESKATNQKVIYPELLTEAEIHALRENNPAIRLVRDQVKDLCRHGGPLSLKSIRKAIPKECFVKKWYVALAYLVMDLMMVFSSLWATRQLWYNMSTLFPTAVHGEEGDEVVQIMSAEWSLLLLFTVIKAPLILCCQMFTSLFYCGLFALGHDCAHNLFAYDHRANNIAGWIAHGAILFPFTAWRRGHISHHLKHNHYTEDYGSRFDVGPLANDCWAFDVTRHRPGRATLTMPFFGMPVYVYLPTFLGVDGCHLLPGIFSGDRLWNMATSRDLILGWISTVVVITYFLFYYYALYHDVELGYLGSIVDFSLLFGPAWLGGMALIFITGYFQHHSDPTHHSCCYDDTTWHYVIAGFQTMDRVFGVVWDHIFHHLTDGHVAHHLFFASIPQYNLRKATVAIREHLDKHGLSEYYRCHEQKNWLVDFLTEFHKIGFRATFLTERDHF